MRVRIFIFCVLTGVLSLHGEEHITISDPASWTTQALAPYVGQDVIFDTPLVLSSNTGMTIGPRRLFTASNQAFPRTDEYKSVLSLNATGAMTISGVSGYHRCGEKVYNLKAHVNSTNSLTWISGEWRGNTREEMENADIRKMVHLDDCDACLLVCGFNLENYYVTHLGQQYMGANSSSEHQIQRAKVSKALKKINADIFGLVELEQGNEAIGEIVNDLNKNLPNRNYQFFNDADVGTFQKVDFVYDSKRVKPIGMVQKTSFNTISGDKHKMICFEELTTGERFIYAINHFKAKSGSGSGKDADQGDGQGSFNATRTGEAQAVIDQYKRYSPNPSIREYDILIMGDLNAYAKEDPIKRFLDNDFLDLHRAFHADSSYSYQFGGLAGYLDHAIGNSTLYPQVTGMTGFHINSDEDDYYTYDKSGNNSMFRCSDHDPVIVGLKLDSTLVYDPSPTINTMDVQSGDAKELVITHGVKDGQHSFYAIFSIQGFMLETKEITESTQKIDLPAAPGIYVLYIYYDGHVYQRKMIVR